MPDDMDRPPGPESPLPGKDAAAVPTAGALQFAREFLADAAATPTVLPQGGARASGAQAPPLPPDRYSLLDVLGQGGMGVVYRARDHVLGRDVAVKVLRGTELVPDEVVERFQREARAAAAFDHPNIVRVLDVGRLPNGSPFYSMDLLAGEDLAHRIVEGSLRAREAVEAVRQVALALLHAHQKGVLHRDIKPQNIFLRRQTSRAEAPTVLDGGGPEVHALLLDFGLAKLAEHDLAEHGQDSRSRRSVQTLTQSGQIMGTPAYMSPEQTLGAREVDTRADIYGLGATLYHALAGKPPFDAASLAELLVKVQREDAAPPSRSNADVDADLDTLTLKCLQKDPKDRYQDAGDLAEDLKRFLSGEAILARPPSRRERLVRWIRRRPTATAVTLAVTATALAAAGWAIGGRAMDAREVASLRRSAEDALSRGDAEEAGALARRAIEIAPSDSTLEALSARARAAACVARSDQYLHRRGELLEEAKRLSAEAASAQAKLEDWDPPSKKFPAWGLEERAIAARARAEDLLSRAYQELTLAIGFSRDDARALSKLAALWMERYEEASARRDEAAMRDARRWVEQYDREGRFRGRFERKATLAIATEPAGAEAYAFRYEEREHRMVPCPYDWARGEALAPPEATLEKVDLHGTAYPLAFSEANRLGTTPGRFGLAPGSYLIVLRAPGRVDVRYPVLLDIDAPWEGQVRLRMAAEYPRVPPGAWTEDPTEYWCLVPGGAFIAGHDAGADNPYDAPIKPIGDFFVARYESTMGEWKAFLEDPELGKTGALTKYSDDQDLVNQFPLYRTGVMLELTGSKFPRDTPVLMVGWSISEAFGKWVGVRTEAAGRGLVVGLPTEAQWEKAARGVDGRYFPWGNRFDWAFCGGARSLSAPGTASSDALAAFPVGKFALDESPYGVRDLAGGAPRVVRGTGGGGGIASSARRRVPPQRIDRVPCREPLLGKKRQRRVSHRIPSRGVG